MPNGRLDESVSAAEKALKADPLNADTWRRLRIDQYFRGDYHAARQALQRALEINPQQSNTAAFLGFTVLVTGDPASALPLSQRATIELFRRQGATLAAHDLGHAIVAQRWLDEMIAKDANGGAYQIAEVFAWWGAKDKAIQWLERASLFAARRRSRMRQGRPIAEPSSAGSALQGICAQDEFAGIGGMRSLANWTIESRRP